MKLHESNSMIRAIDDNKLKVSFKRGKKFDISYICVRVRTRVCVCTRIYSLFESILQFIQLVT